MKPIGIIVSKHLPGVKSMALNLTKVSGMVDIVYLEDLFKWEIVYRAERRALRNVSFTFANLKQLIDNYQDRIILGGWTPVYPKLIKLLNKRGIKPSVMWCSTLGQMEMTCNMVDYRSFLELVTLNNDGAIRYILLNERLFDEMGFLKNSVYFPHTLYLEEFTRFFKGKIKTERLFKIDLFVPVREGKNILTQISALSASRFSDAIELHINFSHPYITPILNEFPLKIKKHGWLPWDEYLELLSGMHLSMQVTHTESFNYAVAERMAMGVPALVSFNIYNLSRDEYLARYLCVKGVDSVKSITEKVDYLLDNPALLNELRSRVKERIERVMAEKNELAVSLLKKLFL